MGQVHSQERSEVEKRAIEVWVKYSKRYRELVPEYEKLLKKKRELKIVPLNPLRKSVIEEIPEIELLRIRSKRELRSKLKKYTTGAISAQVIAANMMIESHAFRTIESCIYDYKYEIRHFKDRKKKPGLCAYDSNYVAVGSYHV